MAPRSPTYADHTKDLPQIVGDGAKTWVTRGANFVIAVSDVVAGAVLSRADNPDEYWVLLADVAAAIEAGGDRIDAKPESLTVVPPGASSVTASGKGRIVRVFSSRAVDMATAAINADDYAAGAAEVAPLEPWPAPPDGFRLRTYQPFAYEKPETNMRCFRSTNLMVNVTTRRTAQRDVTKLSPHSHADFEQGSLVLEGDYVHHLRWPWTPDMREWRDDEAHEIASPSVAIIPAKVIHTSRNIGPRRSWLIDIFAPPRKDFSERPGFVLNAGDYPSTSELMNLGSAIERCYNAEDLRAEFEEAPAEMDLRVRRSRRGGRARGRPTMSRRSAG